MRKFRIVSKKVAAFSLCGIMMLGLTACGSGAEANDMATESYFPTTNSGMAWDSGVSYDKAVVEEEVYYESKAEYGMADSILAGNTSASGGSEDTLVSTSTRKVIKTANLNLQTLEFDAFAAALDQKIAETGAYLQYADVSGSDYYGGRKSANYTVRVPEANLDMFLAGIEGIATVTNKTLGEEDVTLNYVDTEARIKTLEIEQERLLALLEKAEDLDSIIMLEQRLSEVRYSIESHQSRLRTYDDKITYSTVRIYVYEVARVQEKEPETIWERISNGWANTMYDISSGAQDFLVWAVVNLPYLLFWGVVLVVLVVVLKKKKAKRIAKKQGKQSENNETVLDSKE
ncbi:MAG: DUF4349 domain-containing protein [Lachnospiraceae bacterium]|nr:DUF4349 domain-containing protein [Lachnospiraceae bacterium]